MTNNNGYNSYTPTNTPTPTYTPSPPPTCQTPYVRPLPVIQITMSLSQREYLSAMPLTVRAAVDEPSFCFQFVLEGLQSCPVQEASAALACSEKYCCTAVFSTHTQEL